MTIGKRLERVIMKLSSSLNRPVVDCIFIGESFSMSSGGHVQPEGQVDSALVWTPCGWRVIQRISGETHEQFTIRIIGESSKPSIA